ncbi:AMP-dependent synthetase/ligase [Micrococcaceae sp. AOP34-BR2-30]
MREFSTDKVIQVPQELNTTDLLERQVERDPANTLFAVQDTPGHWRDISAAEFHHEVKVLARGMASAGIQPGDKVGIMAPTSYEWTLLDFAIWYAGAVSIPIYETSSPSQVAWIVEDAGVKATFCASATHQRIVETAIRQEKLPALTAIWLIENDGLNEVRRTAENGPGEEEMESRRSRANLDDLSTIIYTSGTTGKPKGCELTHGNFTELTLQTLATDLGSVVSTQASTVMFIPLAHVFARFISVLAVGAGSRVGHTADIKHLVDDLQSFKPTFLLAVPRVFEKVYNGAKLKAEAGGKGKIFETGAQTAIDYSKARESGKVPFGLKAKHALFDKLLFGKLRDAMGGQVTHAVSGGGPLGARLGHFFAGIGVNIMEGYGLTETTAPVTVNRPGLSKIGTVGLPLPGNAVKISDDGEIFAKGVCLMNGYHNREDLTSDAIDSDGWFATGDLGELDQDGYLTIKGRKKEILVTASGKNVSPAQLEDQVRADSIVSQCLVVGDNRPFIAALVTLDADTLPGWLSQNNIDQSTPIADLAEHPKVLEHIQATIDKANDSVSRAESIRAFRITREDFTIESGQMTPSLKIKRDVVARDFEDLIEDIYAQKDPNKA